MFYSIKKAQRERESNEKCIISVEIFKILLFIEAINKGVNFHVFPVQKCSF